MKFNCQVLVSLRTAWICTSISLASGICVRGVKYRGAPGGGGRLQHAWRVSLKALLEVAMSNWNKILWGRRKLNHFLFPLICSNKCLKNLDFRQILPFWNLKKQFIFSFSKNKMPPSGAKYYLGPGGRYSYLSNWAGGIVETHISLHTNSTGTVRTCTGTSISTSLVLMSSEIFYLDLFKVNFHLPVHTMHGNTRKLEEMYGSTVHYKF